MVALVAEHLDHEVAGAVDDLRMVVKIPRGVHESSKPHDPDDPVEVTATGSLELGDDVEAAQAGGRIALLESDIHAELALVFQCAVGKGDLPGHEHQVASHGPGHIIRRRSGGFGKPDAEFGEACFDLPHHYRSFLWFGPSSGCLT